MIELPDKKKCFNLSEQVAQNLRNITYLAEEYKNIDALPAIWQVYKEEFDSEMETFEGWTTTFEGWDTTLSTYLVNMSSAAVSAIAGQNIAPAAIAATGKITSPEIVESMAGYSFGNASSAFTIIYAGAVKTGNKLTLVVFAQFNSASPSNLMSLGEFTLPSAVLNKIYPYELEGNTRVVNNSKLEFFSSLTSSVTVNAATLKYSSTLQISLRDSAVLQANTDYYVRYEATFLLSDSLI